MTSNRPIYAAVPGGEVQREMAFRAGVNLVMYALTGNYKADQVHVPALLERLGSVGRHELVDRIHSLRVLARALGAGRCRCRAVRAALVARTPRRGSPRAGLRDAAACHRQPAFEAGRPRAAERCPRRGGRRQPEPDHRRPRPAHRDHPQGPRDAAEGLPQSRRALGQLDIDLRRQRPRRHHAVHRPRQGPGRRAARPSRRRDHAHRRQRP